MATHKKRDGQEPRTADGELRLEAATVSPCAAFWPGRPSVSEGCGLGLSGLTEIEQRIVLGLARGRSVAELADSLNVTALTVRILIKRAYAALGIRSKAQLLARLEGQAVH